MSRVLLVNRYTKRTRDSKKMKNLSDKEKQAMADAFRDCFSRGESYAEIRRAIREKWAAINGASVQEVLNFATQQELDSILRLNDRLIFGARWRRADLLNITEPAAELLVEGNEAELAAWWQRWNKAAASVNWEHVATDGTCRALLISPIWQALSPWGYPFPPFDAECKTSRRLIDFPEAQAAGLIKDGSFIDEGERQAQGVPSPAFIFAPLR